MLKLEKGLLSYSDQSLKYLVVVGWLISSHLAVINKASIHSEGSFPKSEKIHADDVVVMSSGSLLTFSLIRKLNRLLKYPFK